MNEPQQTEPQRGHVAVLIMGLLLAGTILLAVKLNQDRNASLVRITELERAVRSAPETSQTGGNPRSPTSPARQQAEIYRLARLLEQKDATIRELRQGRGRTTTRQPSLRSRAREIPQAHSEPTVVILDDAANVPLSQLKGAIVERLKFVSEIETADLTPDQIARARNLADQLDMINEHIDSIDEANVERALQQRAELAAMLNRLDELMREQQAALLYRTGQKLGYDEDSAHWFADYIGYVNRMTTLSPGLQKAREYRGPDTAE